MEGIFKMISIIIPVYNVQEYLDKCICSIVNQTYSELELILIDDGSSDESGAICDKWALEDKRIHVIHQKNSGVSSARNTGLLIAKGDYISFIDADDYIENNMYEVMLHDAAKNKSDIVFCGYYEVDGEKLIRVIPETTSMIDNKTAIKACVTGWQLTVWNKIFKRSSIIDSKGQLILFNEDLFVGEDAFWLTCVLLNAKKITCIKNAKYYYRINRAGSAVNLSRGEKKIQSCMSRLEAGKRCFEILEQQGNIYCYLMFRRCVFSARDIACETYFIRDTYMCKQYMKLFKQYLSKYSSMKKESSDINFIIKNYIIFLIIKFRMPRPLLKFILKLR